MSLSGIRIFCYCWDANEGQWRLSARHLGLLAGRDIYFALSAVTGVSAFAVRFYFEPHGSHNQIKIKILTNIYPDNDDNLFYFSNRIYYYCRVLLYFSKFCLCHCHENRERPDRANVSTNTPPAYTEKSYQSYWVTTNP